MLSITHKLPAKDEYQDYYASYINKVPGSNVLDVLRKLLKSTPEMLSQIEEEKGDYVYQLGKWTVKEVLMHIADSERVFAYRALRFARNDHTPIPGFEQNDYVPFTSASSRSLQSIIDELISVRSSTISLLNGFNDEMMERSGCANNSLMSVRALFFVIAGHEIHHMDVLKSRYALFQ